MDPKRTEIFGSTSKMMPSPPPRNSEKTISFMEHLQAKYGAGYVDEDEEFIVSEDDFPISPFNFDTIVDDVSKGIEKDKTDYSREIAELVTKQQELAISQMNFRISKEELLEGLDPDPFPLSPLNFKEVLLSLLPELQIGEKESSPPSEEPASKKFKGNGKSTTSDNSDEPTPTTFGNNNDRPATKKVESPPKKKMPPPSTSEKRTTRVSSRPHQKSSPMRLEMFIDWEGATPVKQSEVEKTNSEIQAENDKISNEILEASKIPEATEEKANDTSLEKIPEILEDPPENEDIGGGDVEEIDNTEPPEKAPTSPNNTITETTSDDRKKRRYFKCATCATLIPSNSDHDFRRHLLTKHSIEVVDPKDFENSKVEVALDQTSTEELGVPPKEVTDPRCGLCYTTFETRYSLKLHLDEIHPQVGAKMLVDPDFRCATCLQTFEDGLALGKHCSCCAERRPSDATLLQLAKRLISCDFCTKSHAGIGDAQSCFANHQISRCILCLALFKDEALFLQHLHGYHDLQMEPKVAWRCFICVGRERESVNNACYHFVSEHLAPLLMPKGGLPRSPLQMLRGDYRGPAILRRAVRHGVPIITNVRSIANLEPNIMPAEAKEVSGPVAPTENHNLVSQVVKASSPVPADTQELKSVSAIVKTSTSVRPAAEVPNLVSPVAPVVKMPNSVAPVVKPSSSVSPVAEMPKRVPIVAPMVKIITVPSVAPVIKPSSESPVTEVPKSLPLTAPVVKTSRSVPPLLKLPQAPPMADVPKSVPPLQLGTPIVKVSNSMPPVAVKSTLPKPPQTQSKPPKPTLPPPQKAISKNSVIVTLGTPRGPQLCRKSVNAASNATSGTVEATKRLSEAIQQAHIPPERTSSVVSIVVEGKTVLVPVQVTTKVSSRPLGPASRKPASLTSFKKPAAPSGLISRIALTKSHGGETTSESLSSPNGCGPEMIKIGGKIYDYQLFNRSQRQSRGSLGPRPQDDPGC